MLLDSRTIESADASNNRVEFLWQGDYNDGWIVAGRLYDWSLTEPIDREDILPDQSGNNREFLTTNGTVPSWTTLPVASQSTAGIVSFDILDPKYGPILGIRDLPVPLVTGHEYVLLTADTVQQDKRIQWLQAQTTLRTLSIGESEVTALHAYSSGFSIIGARNKVYLQRGNTPSKTPETVYLYNTYGGTRSSYTVSTTPTGGLASSFREVQGLSYAGMTTGAPGFIVNVQFTDDTFLYPDIRYEIGTYYATGPITLSIDPASPAYWARFGQPEPRSAIYQVL